MSVPLIEFLLGVYFIGAGLPAFFGRTPETKWYSYVPILAYGIILVILAFFGGSTFITR